jgi:hypothetical protein
VRLRAIEVMQWRNACRRELDDYIRTRSTPIRGDEPIQPPPKSHAIITDLSDQEGSSVTSLKQRCLTRELLRLGRWGHLDLVNNARCFRSKANSG